MFVTLFDIPIYLRSHDKYYAEQQAFENRKIKELSSMSGRSIEEEKKRLYDNPFLHDYFLWWPPWRFNDIVGWASINYDGRYFVEGWLLNKKRVLRDPRHRKGNIIRSGKITEQIAGFSNDELKQGLISILKELSKKLEKKGRYINLQYWITLVSFLDCKGYVEMLQSKE